MINFHDNVSIQVQDLVCIQNIETCIGSMIIFIVYKLLNHLWKFLLKDASAVSSFFL